MGSQYSVTGPYGHTFSFLDIWAVKTSSLVLFKATQSHFPRSWVVNTPSPGHLATHSLFPRIMSSQYSVTGHMATFSPFPRSWVVKTPSTGPYRHTFSFPDIMGSQDSVTGPYGHTFFFLDIKESQDSVTGPFGHTFSFLDIMGQLRLRHRAIWPHILFLDIMGSQDSVTGHMALFLLSRYHGQSRTSS
ncbi:hypothetical protein BgiBS90_015886 [Biomphalaria glabrata]|nr:hypothetical protein BgiBS90_015886 [Biomphalaria glabrata]